MSFDHDLSETSFSLGGVPGAQTVPRAELQAATWASNFVGAEQVKSDSAYVVHGADKVKAWLDEGLAPPKLLHSTNADLWQAWALEAQLSGRTDVRKVTAHLSMGQAVRQNVDFEDYAGNACADALASVASSLNQAPEGTRILARDCIGIQYHIAMRIAVVDCLVKRWENEYITAPVQIPAPSPISQQAAAINNVVSALGHLLTSQGRQRNEVQQMWHDSFQHLCFRQHFLRGVCLF